MGRKGKELSNEVRRMVIDMYRNRMSVTGIGKLLQMPRSTLSTICVSWRDQNKSTRTKRRGKKRMLKNSYLRRLRLLILTGRFETKAMILAKFQRIYDVSISRSTFKRYLKVIGASRRPNCKKEVTILRHRKARLAWVKQRKFWTVQQWSKVIFSDECCVKIGQDKRVYVWKMADEGYYRPDLYGDNKKPKCQVMIWGCISWFGVGTISAIDGTLNSQGYLDILEENVWPVIAKHFPRGDYIFQDDGASIHTAHLIRNYKQRTGMKTMTWPAKSPDLNIIENLWMILKHKIHQDIDLIKNSEDLKRIIRKAWDDIQVNYIRSLYSSLPRRLMKVATLKGHRTRY